MEHPDAVPVFVGAVMAILTYALWRWMARRAERKRARYGGAMWTSDQEAGLDIANLSVWILFVLVATPFLIWLVPRAPGFRWLFVGVAAVVLFNGILTLIRAAISICKRRYANASLRLFENAPNAQAVLDFVLPPR
ncbi:MAG: hypothetical protein Q7T25_13500 [Sideroxyarcus sp.]|nr:hypothetical protein [Sideroxyarcus sp.]